MPAWASSSAPTKRNGKEKVKSKAEESVLPFCCCCNKIPQTGWLRTTGVYSLTVWRPEVQNQGVSRVVSFWRLWGRICLFRTFSGSAGCWQPLVFLGLWLRHSSLCLHHHVASPLCVSACRIPLPIRTPVTGLGPWFITLTSCSSSVANIITGRLTNLNSITPAKALFPSRVTFTGMGV